MELIVQKNVLSNVPVVTVIACLDIANVRLVCLGLLVIYLVLVTPGALTVLRFVRAAMKEQQIATAR